MQVRVAPLLAWVLLACAAAAAARADDWTACDAAAREAEAAAQLPPGLLLAIGRVESGRQEPGSGRVVPWPWTINAAGKGQSFSDAAQALVETGALLSRGIGSIDIGCFQVNIGFHPEAFSSLEAAFDPAANARAAAGFLTRLRGQTGSWDGAIAAYHSSTPERGLPYRLRVLAAWGEGVPPSAPAAAVLREVAWSPARDGVQVWRPSSSGAGPSVISIHAGPEAPAGRAALQ